MTQSQRAFWLSRLKNAPHFPVFLKLVMLLEDRPASELTEIAESAKVSVQTLYNWIRGSVFFPHLRTVAAVAHAMGYNLTLQSQRQTLKKAA